MEATSPLVYNSLESCRTPMMTPHVATTIQAIITKAIHHELGDGSRTVSTGPTAVTLNVCSYSATIWSMSVVLSESDCCSALAMHSISDVDGSDNIVDSTLLASGGWSVWPGTFGDSGGSPRSSHSRSTSWLSFEIRDNDFGMALYVWLAALLMNPNNRLEPVSVVPLISKRLYDKVAPSVNKNLKVQVRWPLKQD